MSDGGPAVFSLELGDDLTEMRGWVHAFAEWVRSDVRVPGRCVVGGRDRLEERLARVREGGRSGEQAAMKTFEASRPGVAAMAVGVARAAAEYAADYSRTRVQFGRPIGQNQGVAFILADMRA